MAFKPINLQLKRLYSRNIILIYIFTIALLSSVLILYDLLGIPIEFLMNDIISLAKKKQYAENLNMFSGLITNMGVFLWVYSGACLLFTYWVFKSRLKKEQRNFLLLGGVFSYVFGSDDFLTAHETIGSMLKHSLAIPQQRAELIVFFFYGLLLLCYLWKSRSVILESNFIFLLIAFTFFGLSIIMDMEKLHFSSASFNYWLEESAKFFGILNWTIYHIDTTKTFLINPANEILAFNKVKDRTIFSKDIA